MIKVFILLWFGLPLIPFALSGSGDISWTPFGHTIEPETALNYIDNLMKGGSWLLIGWSLPLLIGATLNLQEKEGVGNEN